MSEAKKNFAEKRKRRQEQSQGVRVEDLELRNYLTKKIKSEEDGKIISIEKPQVESRGGIRVTNNGKQSIKKYVEQGLALLKQAGEAEMHAEDKSISRLVTVVEIIKHKLGGSDGKKTKLTQENRIFNKIEKEESKKIPCMKITLHYPLVTEAL